MKTKLVLTLLAGMSVLLTGILYAKHHIGEKFSKSDAASIARQGSFELDMKPEAALPLFTAPGEKLWIEHWDPTNDDYK